MVRINPGPVKLSFFVYLISHIFAQGNYILLILYRRGPQVNTTFLDFLLDIETWTWPRTFSCPYPFQRSTAHTDWPTIIEKVKPHLCITFICHQFAPTYGEYLLNFFFNLPFPVVTDTANAFYKTLASISESINKTTSAPSLKETTAVFCHCLSK